MVRFPCVTYVYQPSYYPAASYSYPGVYPYRQSVPTRAVQRSLVGRGGGGESLVASAAVGELPTSAERKFLPTLMRLAVVLAPLLGNSRPHQDDSLLDLLPRVPGACGALAGAAWLSIKMFLKRNLPASASKRHGRGLWRRSRSAVGGGGEPVRRTLARRGASGDSTELLRRDLRLFDDVGLQRLACRAALEHAGRKKSAGAAAADKDSSR